MGKPSRCFGSRGQGEPTPTTLFLEPLPRGPQSDPKVKLIPAPDAGITIKRDSGTDIASGPIPRKVPNIQEAPVVWIIPGLSEPHSTASLKTARSTVRKVALTAVATQVITTVISQDCGLWTILIISGPFPTDWLQWRLRQVVHPVSCEVHRVSTALYLQWRLGQAEEVVQEAACQRGSLHPSWQTTGSHVGWSGETGRGEFSALPPSGRDCPSPRPACCWWCQDQEGEGTSASPPAFCPDNGWRQVSNQRSWDKLPQRWQPAQAGRAFWQSGSQAGMSSLNSPVSAGGKEALWQVLGHSLAIAQVSIINLVVAISVFLFISKETLILRSMWQKCLHKTVPKCTRSKLPCIYNRLIDCTNNHGSVLISKQMPKCKQFCTGQSRIFCTCL